MTHVGEHAIVLGASLAGLAAAAALADRFHRVTIVERDALPQSGEQPQTASPKDGTSTSCCPQAGRACPSCSLASVTTCGRDAHVIDTTEFRFHIARREPAAR